VTQPTTLYQLIEAHLDGTLADYVAAGLSARKSWRTIAAEIERDTNCLVSFETLRDWFKDRIQIEVKVA
jgi:hypothetical protein